MRFAIYAVPPAAHPLWHAASSWLGRNPETGAEIRPELPPWLDRQRWLDITADASRYGFHGTLKPPIALAAGATAEALETALAGFAAASAGPGPMRFKAATIAGFVAFLPDPPAPALNRLADDCVTAFDRFRAPPSPAELARRRAAGLTPAQETHLARWGYPYVFDQFRYHMTLSARLASPERARIRDWLELQLAPLIEAPMALELALFVETVSGGPFALRRRFAWGG
jgi:hypothetical protein